MFCLAYSAENLPTLSVCESNLLTFENDLFNASVRLYQLRKCR